MKKTLSRCALLVGLSLGISAAPADLVFTNALQADNAVFNLDRGGTVYASETTLTIGRQTILATNYESRGLLMTSVTNLPAGQSIGSAQLHLYFNPFQTRGIGQTVNLYRITSAWTPSQVTWSNAAAGTPWTAPGGDFLGTPSVSYVLTAADSNAYIHLDVTSDVAAWYGGQADNYGWMVVNPNVGNQIYQYRFRTTEEPGLTLDPYLTISVVPEPGTTVLLLLGGGLLLRRFRSRRC